MRNVLCFMTACMCLGLLAIDSTARGEEKFTRQEDVIYGRKYGMALTMDVFTPKEGANGAAAMIMMSGGWVSSHDQIQPVFVSPLTKRGYTVFAVVHGSQPKFTIPECIADVNRAVRYVRAHAGDFKIDPNRIGVTGASAGGHLSLMLGCAGDEGDPKAKDPVDRVSSRVQAVVCLFPPTDFLNFGKPGVQSLGTEEIHQFKAPFDFHVHDPTTKMFKPVDLETRLKICHDISPIYHVTKDDAPTMIIHGDKDPLVPLQQSELIMAKFQEVGVPAELVIKKGAAHGGVEFLGDFNRMPDWFDKYLKPTEATAQAAK